MRLLQATGKLPPKGNPLKSRYCRLAGKSQSALRFPAQVHVLPRKLCVTNIDASLPLEQTEISKKWQGGGSPGRSGGMQGPNAAAGARMAGAACAA